MELRISPLRQFVFAAVLWLPACFALWAVLSGPIVWPVARLSGLVLGWLLPDVIHAIEQNGAALEAITTLVPEVAARAGQVPVLALEFTPMIYAWCLPLFAGLVMAAPITARQRLLQFAVGLPVLFLVVSWGATFDVLYLLQFKGGPLGAAALARHGWNADAIGLGYQFGYLILPAVTPVVLWILLNRGFIESLVEWVREPSDGPDGHTPPDEGA